MAIAQRLPSGAAPPSRVKQYLRRAWGGGALTVADGEAVVFSGVDGTLTKSLGAKPVRIPTTVPVVDGNAAVWDGTDGTKLKDAGKKPMLVPTTLPVVDGDLALFDGTDGTKVKDGGALGKTLIASGNLSGASVVITGIPATYSYLCLLISGASSGSTEQTQVQLSTNNGVSYDTTAANYQGIRRTGTTFTLMTTASLTESTTHTAAQSDTVQIELFCYQGGPNARARVRVLQNAVEYTGEVTYIGSTSAINALKILGSAAGTFDAGTYSLWGMR